MKPLLILILSVSLSIAAFGQAYNDSARSREHFLILSLGAEYFTYNNYGGLLNISFPYTTTDQSGNTSHHIFNQSSSTAFSNAALGGGFGVKYMGLRYSIDLTFAYLPSNMNATIALGAGYNFYLDIYNNGGTYIADKPIVITPFFSIIYFDADNDDFLNSIDNQNTIVNVLGNTANPTYQYKASKYSFGTSTANAQELEVYYSQNSFLLFPGIQISTNPHSNKFYIGFKAGYYFSISDNEGISLTQDNSNTVSSLIPFGTQGLTSTLNGQNTVKPYLHSGFYARLSLGFDVLKTSPSNHSGFYEN